MNAMQLLKKAVGVETFWLGTASVFAGSAAAASHANFALFPMALCLLFSIFMQAANNLLHAHYDIKHNYIDDDKLKYFMEGKTDKSPQYVLSMLKEGVYTSLIFAATTGFALIIYGGLWMASIGVVITLVELLNFVGRHPLIRSRWSPISSFLLFGPIGVIGTELAEIGDRINLVDLSWWNFYPGLVLGFIVGIMAMNTHIILGFTNLNHSEKEWAPKNDNGRQRRIVASILFVTTITYSILAFALPHILLISEWEIFLPVPIVSLIMSLIQIGLLLKRGKERIAWKLSLANVMLIGIGAFVIFLSIGY